MNHLASSARQPGSLPLGARNVYALFRFPSQQLFFVSRKFFAATVSRFLKARGAFMLPFAFEVNNFFPFRETFRSTVEPVVFPQSRGAFMLPFAFEVNHFFSFPETFVSP